MTLNTATAPSRMLLTPTEIATMTGRSTRTVRRWISQGRLPAVRLGRSVWIPARAVELAFAVPFTSDEESAQPLDDSAA